MYDSQKNPIYNKISLIQNLILKNRSHNFELIKNSSAVRWKKPVPPIHPNPTEIRCETELLEEKTNPHKQFPTKEQEKKLNQTIPRPFHALYQINFIFIGGDNERVIVENF